MLDNLKGKNILLASNSPRRKELLQQMGVNFTVVCKPGIDESYPDNLHAKMVPEFIANKKAMAYADDLKADDILITADTVVLADRTVLGKPADAIQARAMLRSLSGKTHKVITGVVIASADKKVAFSVKTKVTFRTLSDEVINFYVDNYAPMDKAGSYGIQEWIGLVGIDYIEGSYQNVMGLPTQRLFAELALW